MFNQITHSNRQEWQQHEGIVRRRTLLDTIVCRVYGVDDAIMVASLAATAASTGASMAAQGKAQSAVNRAKNAELLRQQEYQKQAQQVADESLAQAGRGTADTQIQQGADARQAAYNRITATPSAAPSVPQEVNRIVATPSPTATANTQSNALAAVWNRILGGAQARLGGYQDWGLTQDTKNRRAAEQLGIIGNNARGSENVLAGELDYATHAGDSLNTLAGALGAIGQVGGAYSSVGRRRVGTVNTNRIVGDTGD